MVRHTTRIKIEFCSCKEGPLDPWYAAKPYNPTVPMSGPYCKRCSNLVKQDGVADSYTVTYSTDEAEND